MAAIPVPVHFDGHNINIITEDSPSTCKNRTKGVNYGPSQKAASAAIGALFAKKKAPPKKSSDISDASGKGDRSQYTQLFRKYEMLMKFGINVHGAVGRMRQDSVDKSAIASFEKKHNAFAEEEEKIDINTLGLMPKK
eukprot:157750_1